MKKILIILLIFLVACEGQMPQQYNQQPNPIIQEQDNIVYTPVETNVIPSTDAFDQNDLGKYHFSNYDKIFFRFHGVDRGRMLLIVTSIHPKYFEGVKIVEFVYSNPKFRSSFANGWYYPDSRKITLYVYDESDGFVHRNLLHELKHHYCYINIGNAEINHESCFLNTPIDQEYNFIQ